MTLGQLIKKARTERDLSQPALAETIGIEQSYLSKLENDKSIPSNEIFRQLLNGLELSLDTLLSQLDQHYVQSTLCQISDVDHWLSKKRLSQNKFSRRLLLLSSALIVLATTFFYAGFSELLFSSIQNTYQSEGVIRQGEPFNYFESGAYESTPNELHEKVRMELRERYDPQEIKTFVLRGESFMEKVEGGQRRFMYVRSSQVTRIENSILQILGILLLTAGILGFVVERRFSKMEQG